MPRTPAQWGPVRRTPDGQMIEGQIIHLDDPALDLHFRVEPRLRHKNQKIMAFGPDLELPVVQERQPACTDQG
jgi:hypothetical protein